MKSFFPSPGIILPVLIASALIASGCAKHPPATERVSPPPAAEELGPDKTIVAKVNGVELTAAELDEIEFRMKASDENTSPSKSEEEARKKALDQLILQELAYQEARRQGLEVKPSDIDNAITAITGHEQKDYEDFLARQHVTNDEFRAKIERTILLRLIFNREVLEKAHVTENEARKEYEDHKGQYVAPDKITVVDVFVPAKKDVEPPLKYDDADAVKKAGDLLAALKMHKDSNPWMLSRDDSVTVQSRDLDKEKEPALYDAARKLKEGELSGVIQTPDGAHFLQLTRIIPKHEMSFDEVKGPLEMQLLAIAQLKRLQEWQQELKKSANIELLDGFRQ